MRSAFWRASDVCRGFSTSTRLDGSGSLRNYEVTSHPSIFDGIRLHTGQQIAVIQHNARVLLSCERVILNFLQRMAGIATTTRKFVDAVERHAGADSRYSQDGARAARGR